MDNKKMKKYLESLMILESEKYRLEEIKKALENDKDNKEKELNTEYYKTDWLNEDRNTKKNNLIKEIENKKNENKNAKISRNSNIVVSVVYISSLVAIAVFIIFLIFGLLDYSFLMFICIVGGTILAHHFIYGKDDKKKITETNEEVVKLEKELNRKLKNLDIEYDKLIKEAEESDKTNRKNLKVLVKNDEKNLIELKKIYDEVVKKLDNNYANDIIFKKYRNLSAITMFYEYFSSSRVFELEGKDGAYNLYESELRQNIIINNLESINNNLEQIKNNQYCMYNELKNISSSLNTINKNLVSGLSDIATIETANLAVNCEISKNIKTIKNIQVYDFIMGK